MARARSKAWISATQQIPSSEHLHRMTMIAPPVAAGFAVASPEALFPGAGGLPVSVDGTVVAGIAASGATVSPFFPAGVDPRVLNADGERANPEDLLIAYALGLPYAGQHGDDQKRWKERFGELVIDPAESLGMAPAPGRPPGPARVGEGTVRRGPGGAAARGIRVAVAVVDRGGDPIQQDLMDGGPAARSRSRKPWRAPRPCSTAAAPTSIPASARLMPSRRWSCPRSSVCPAACRSMTRGEWSRPSASAAAIR